METQAHDAMMSVVLGEPEALVSAALKKLVESSGPYNIVAQVGTAEEILSSIDRFGPDVIVMEIILPGPSGLEALLELERRNSNVKVLIVTRTSSAEIIRRILAISSLSIVLKNDSAEELSRALTSCIDGQQYISRSVQQILEDSEDTNGWDKSNSVFDPLVKLSSREREIFYFLAEGLQNAQIAKRLFISPRTVETHRARIVRKLGIKSNGELIRFAIRNGLSFC